MTARKRAAAKRAASTETEAASGPVATKDVPHPHDPNIWSDGRPRPGKGGNPYPVGTGRHVAWEAGIGRAPSGTTTTGRRTRPAKGAAPAAPAPKTEA